MNKIIQFAKDAPNYNGGIESVVREINDYYKARDFNTEVVCFSDASMAKEGIRECKTNFFCCSQKLSSEYFYQSFQQRSETDKIIFHVPNYLALINLVFVSFLFPKAKRYVFWHADIISENPIKYILSLILRPLEILAILLANKVIFTSQNYADNSYISSFIKKEKICIVPLGRRDNANTRRRRYSIKKPTKILFVGRLVKYKNVNMLIDAVTKLSDVELTIVGNGELSGPISKHIQSLGLGKKIKLLNNVSDEELKTIYEYSDVFVLPSKNKAEAFGVVLIEAMMHGLPLVTFEIEGSGVTWVNQHGVTGFIVKQFSASALGKAINLLCVESEMRKQFSKASRYRFIQNFTADKMLQALDHAIDVR